MNYYFFSVQNYVGERVITYKDLALRITKNIPRWEYTCTIDFDANFDYWIFSIGREFNPELVERLENLIFPHEYEIKAANEYFRWLYKTFDSEECKFVNLIIDYFSWLYESVGSILNDMSPRIQSFLSEGSFIANVLNTMFCNLALIIKHWISFCCFKLSYCPRPEMLLSMNNNFSFDIISYFDVMCLVIDFCILMLFFKYLKIFFLIKFSLKLSFSNILNFFFHKNSKRQIVVIVIMFFLLVIGDIYICSFHSIYFDGFVYSIIIFVILNIFFMLIVANILYFLQSNWDKFGSVSFLTLFKNILKIFKSFFKIFFAISAYIFFIEYLNSLDSGNPFLWIGEVQNDSFFTYSCFDKNKSTFLVNIFFDHIKFIFLTLLNVFCFFINTFFCLFNLFFAFYIVWLILDLLLFKLAGFDKLK